MIASISKLSSTEIYSFMKLSCTDAKEPRPFCYMALCYTGIEDARKCHSMFFIQPQKLFFILSHILIDVFLESRKNFKGLVKDFLLSQLYFFNFISTQQDLVSTCVAKSAACFNFRYIRIVRQYINYFRMQRKTHIEAVCKQL